MITQKTADAAKARLKVESGFDWQDDPEHPDFGSVWNVRRRQMIVGTAWLNSPLRQLGYMTRRFVRCREFSTAVDQDTWKFLAWEAANRAGRAQKRAEAKIQEMVGADQIEVGGAYFSGESEETIDAVLRKIGAAKGTIKQTWSMDYSWVKTMEEEFDHRPAFKLQSAPTAQQEDDEDIHPFSVILLMLVGAGFVSLIYMAVAGGGQ